jgi:hypothetical protein
MYCNTSESCCSLFELGGFYNYSSTTPSIDQEKEQILEQIKEHLMDCYLYGEDDEIPSAFTATTLEHKQKVYGNALKALGFTRRTFKSRHKDQDRLFHWFRASYPPGIKRWLTAELKKEHNDNW